MIKMTDNLLLDTEALTRQRIKRLYDESVRGTIPHANIREDAMHYFYK